MQSIVRDGSVIGRCRVAEGTDAAKASLDVE